MTMRKTWIGWILIFSGMAFCLLGLVAIYLALNRP